MRQGEGRQPYWSPQCLPKEGEERGGEEQDGDISTTLQCIMKEEWYRISSKLTVISLLRNTGGKNTSKVVVVGWGCSIFSQKHTTNPDLFYVYTHGNIKYKVAQVTQDLQVNAASDTSSTFVSANTSTKTTVSGVIFKLAYVFYLNQSMCLSIFHYCVVVYFFIADVLHWCMWCAALFELWTQALLTFVSTANGDSYQLCCNLNKG